MDSVIEFKDVSKKFKLNDLRVRSFQDILVHRSVKRTRGDFWALKNVSFQIRAGETVGFIGPNGSGKSSILKLVSHIIDPSSGTVSVRGRVTGLLELGAGFHPDLTGRENIYLNASLLGVSRKQIQSRLNDILDFAEIGEFIDMPVRNYSSGMSMRLGFAITTMLDPKILLIDEILAVGDHRFQRKCFERMAELQEQGVTILLVSHSLDQVSHLCKRAIWMEHGQIRANGEAESVLGQYLDESQASGVKRFLPSVALKDDASKRWGTYQAEITEVELLDRREQPQQSFVTGDYFRLRIHYRTQTPVERPAFGLAIYRRDGLHINGPNTVLADCEIACIEGSGYIDYVVEELPLAPERYELTVAIYDHDSTVAYDHHHRLYHFEVCHSHLMREEGVMHIPARWQHVFSGHSPKH